jgi:hypothetical protein
VGTQGGCDGDDNDEDDDDDGRGGDGANKSNLELKTLIDVAIGRKLVSLVRNALCGFLLIPSGSHFIAHFFVQRCISELIQLELESSTRTRRG